MKVVNVILIVVAYFAFVYGWSQLVYVVGPYLIQ
jgi:hypothetical protein